MKILNAAIDVINYRFPIDCEFEIIEEDSHFSISKKKWEKAYLLQNNQVW